MKLQKVNNNKLAQELADFFKRYGYPFLAVELQLKEVYPLIVLWDDSAEITRVIAIADSKQNLLDAQSYATTMAAVMEVAGEAATGTICHVVCDDTKTGFVESLGVKLMAAKANKPDQFATAEELNHLLYVLEQADRDAQTVHNEFRVKGDPVHDNSDIVKAIAIVQRELDKLTNNLGKQN